MADTSNMIQISGDFVADMFPEVRQYQFGRPSYYLNKIAEVDRGNLDLPKSALEKLAFSLPKKMVGVTRTGKTTNLDVIDVVAAFAKQDGLIGSGIVNTLIADTIAEGAMGVMSMRKLLKTIPMASASGMFPAWGKRTKAGEKAKNAEFPDMANDIYNVPVRAQEYGLTTTISKSILEDTNGSFLSSVLKEMGGNMELTIETAALDALINFSSAVAGDIISVAKADALKGLSTARGAVNKAQYVSTGAAVAPLFMSEMMNTYIPGNSDRAMDLVINNSSLPRFAGLEVGETAAIPSMSGVTFDWVATGNIGALVIDPMRAPQIGMRKDVSFDEFDNVLKFALNPVVVMRFGMSDPAKAEGISAAELKALRGAVKRVVMA